MSKSVSKGLDKGKGRKDPEKSGTHVMSTRSSGHSIGGGLPVTIRTRKPSGGGRSKSPAKSPAKSPPGM